MAEKKRVNIRGAIELHYPTEIHWLLFVIALLASFYLIIISYRSVASTVTDACRTLLELNGTLLALVVGFSAFYFAVIDARRIEATRPIQPQWANEIKEAAKLPIIYRKKMKAVSILLTSIAVSYGIFLFVTYMVYIFSLSQTATALIGQPLSVGYNFVLFSPLVTVADPIIMTWYLTRDVAD